MTNYWSNCPGFGQDRVNFHQNPGRGTAGRLTTPRQTEPGIPYHVPSCWVPVGGSWVVGTHLRLGSSRRRSWRTALWVVRCVLCFPLICIVVVPVSLCLLFLLNCPYPDPPVSACFFPFSSTPRRWEGWPHVAFVAVCSQTITISENKLSVSYSSLMPHR